MAPKFDISCATCSRRSLLQGLGVAVAGSLVQSACGGGGGGGQMPDASQNHPDAATATCPTKDLCLDVTKAPYTALANANGSVVVNSTSGRLIVVRTSATAASTLSVICTHQGCDVTYQSSAKDLYCPCHGAKFSMTGTVLQGPASTPLKTYPTSIAGNIITITLG